MDYCENNSNTRIDLLFLDVEMSGISGTELLEQVKKKYQIWRIVFVTSHLESMQAAFSQKTIGFLGKPVNDKEVEKKILEVQEDMMGNVQLRFIGDAGEPVSMLVDDVFYLQGERSYTRIYINQAGKIQGVLVCKTLGTLEKELEIGDKVAIEGQFRSYNSYENEKNRLILTVFAKDIKYLSEEDEENSSEKVSNEVTLIGYICKKPIYRQTPFGREISDILLAVNRAYNKSDYIPAIAWGRNARFCQNIEVGTKVKITGRVQSRNYEKKFEDGTTQTRTAYEVSISSLEIVNEEEENKEVI